MSLNKTSSLRAKWIADNMPVEDMDPVFPYILEVSVPGVGVQKSPTGFNPKYYSAYISLFPLPEYLQIDQ